GGGHLVRGNPELRRRYVGFVAPSRQLHQRFVPAPRYVRNDFLHRLPLRPQLPPAERQLDRVEAEAAQQVFDPLAVGGIGGTEQRNHEMSKCKAAASPSQSRPFPSGIHFPPSPGTPGEGGGGGLFARNAEEDPHPNPPPEYRERGTRIRETQPKVRGGREG